MANQNPMSVAIDLVGLQRLATAVGVSYQAIRKYERGTVTAERALAVCRATDWIVTPHMLRPDLYPNPADAIPPAVAAKRFVRAA